MCILIGLPTFLSSRFSLSFEFLDEIFFFVRCLCLQIYSEILNILFFISCDVFFFVLKNLLYLCNKTRDIQFSIDVTRNHLPKKYTFVLLFFLFCFYSLSLSLCFDPLKKKDVRKQKEFIY